VHYKTCICNVGNNILYQWNNKFIVVVNKSEKVGIFVVAGANKHRIVYPHIQRSIIACKVENIMLFKNALAFYVYIAQKTYAKQCNYE
jgi:hypothetical protein